MVDFEGAWHITFPKSFPCITAPRLLFSTCYIGACSILQLRAYELKSMLVDLQPRNPNRRRLILNPRSQERIFLLRKIIPAGSFVETDDATANRSEQRFLFRDSKWPIVW